MSVIVNEVRKGAYFDSVALMRIAERVRALPGVEDVGLMIGTRSNRELLSAARVLGPDGAAAGPGDLIIALRARGQADAANALAHARSLLDQRRSSAAGASGAQWQPRTLRGAIEVMPDANLALISVPGDFAIAEARKALHRGLHAMIFSDNVPLADEVALKREARDLGLLIMGPDCGTAIIAGVPIAFANAIPRGDIGIIGASGTGIQEVSCLIARAGSGISHAIGTGGRDLKAEVGGITTLMAIDLLDADNATGHIVIVSKPPAPEVAQTILARVGKSRKPFTVCFLGSPALAMPANAWLATTLGEAADFATGNSPDHAAREVLRQKIGQPRAARIQGLYSGGTLCVEAQVVLRRHGLRLASNVPIAGVADVASRNGEMSNGAGVHTLLDLGDDAYTRGRPHPMIEPAVRDAPLLAALRDPAIGVVLLDVVLGFGGHRDPAGCLAQLIAREPKGAILIASVTGTEADRQSLSAQIAKLEAVGVYVAASNAEAAALAASVVAGRS